MYIFVNIIAYVLFNNGNFLIIDIFRLNLKFKFNKQQTFNQFIIFVSNVIVTFSVRKINCSRLSYTLPKNEYMEYKILYVYDINII